MEEHRLIPMKQNYDPQLFNFIYDKTRNLKYKLVSQIDHSKLGVDRDDLLSWFDVKLIFTFNKYYGECTDEILKAKCIKALQFFKCRVLRHAYTKKNQVNAHHLDINDYKNDIKQYPEEYHDTIENFLIFINKIVSKDAYLLVEAELNPPLYIMQRMLDRNVNMNKIPNDLIIEFFDWDMRNPIKYLYSLRKEIKLATDKFRLEII